MDERLPPIRRRDFPHVVAHLLRVIAQVPGKGRDQRDASEVRSELVEVLDVTVEGVVGTYCSGDGTSGDDLPDPLSGLVIPAGADITFTGAGTLAATGIRITEITVETVPVPEPSSILLSLLGSSFLVFRRRR